MNFRLKVHGCIAILIGLALGGIFIRASWIDERLRLARGVAGRSLTPPLVVPKRDGRPVLALMGDSRVSRWPSEECGTSWLWFNRGVGGETTRELLDRFADELQQLRPQAVLVSTGINDAVGISFMAPAEADIAVEHLASRFFALGDEAFAQNVRLYITTIIPPGRPSLLRRLAWSNRTSGIVAAVNAKLRAHAWPPTTVLLDLTRNLFSTDDRQLNDTYRLDTLHLNRSGYAMFRCAVYDALSLPLLCSGQQPEAA